MIIIEKEKVSIVVPIYKVEKYIHQCINSIIRQTYSNLEIILVNDGSPDQCGAIADSYKKVDPRIKVIHKENGGLSDARNAGMAVATGTYTMFVDSDDWINLTMVETMVAYSKEFQADIVQSAFYYVYEDKLLVDHRYIQEEKPLLLDNQRLMFELVRNKLVKNFAWGKLYKTNLIKHIPFKKGVLFEDVFWQHLVMHHVNKYVIIDQPLYYYLQRDDSIVATYTPKNLDIIQGLKERHQFIEKYYTDLVDESYQLILETSLIHYQLLMSNKEKDAKGEHRKKIEQYIQYHLSQLKQAVKANQSLKYQLLLFQFHPNLLRVFHGLRKVLTKMKIIPKEEGLKQVNV